MGLPEGSVESFEVLPFFRGVSEDFVINAPVICRARKDRRPRNTLESTHSAADEWFERRFGIRYRSQALFVTGDRYTARAYAASDFHVVRVVPLGPYKYCWSPCVRDMLSLSLGTSEIDSLLDRATYREDGLAQAHACGNELMLHCDYYVALPIHLFEDSAERNETIIPGSAGAISIWVP